MSKLLKFVNLPSQEKALFCRAIYNLIVFRFKLIYTPTKYLFEQVTNFSCSPPKNCSPCVPPERIACLINQASRCVPFSTCLSKALVGSLLFTKNGCPVDLHIGVFINDSKQLEAHAWLSYDNKIVIGDMPDLRRFKEFPLKRQRAEP